MLKFSYMPIKHNHSSRNGKQIEWIVIHDTGNTGKGSGAMNHYRYFNGGNRGASAHYFVDDKEIIQIVGDSRSAWSVGDNQGKGRYLNGCMNQNSISIEICVNSDGNYQKAYNNAVELTKELMSVHKISHNKVCRHYDVSRKSCPNSMRANNWQLWREFKEKIKQPKKIKIDTSKNGYAKPIQTKEKDVLLDMTEEQLVKIIQREIDKAIKPSKDNKNLGMWANDHFINLNARGLTVNERRFNDVMTRGEVFALLASLTEPNNLHKVIEHSEKHRDK